MSVFKLNHGTNAGGAVLNTKRGMLMDGNDGCLMASTVNSESGRQ